MCSMIECIMHGDKCTVFMFVVSSSRVLYRDSTTRVYFLFYFLVTI